MASSDLIVDPLSSALAGRTVDVVVSGSIGAVESVRFLRALRRLGATTEPWLTAGGARFVTETAVAWAAGRAVRTAFAGDASHIALADAVVIAPASASLIGRIAHGLTDTPASALVASHLGMKRPVLLLPNMHDSLMASPGVRENLAKLATWGVVVLGSRLEEGKQKFPDPATLADDVAHRLNAGWCASRAPVLVTMGTTRGYLDPVRYVSNYSSGKLGSLVAEELFRLGHPTHVVAGPAPHMPRVATQLVRVDTNDAMEHAALAALAAGAKAVIAAASVLDFVPKTRAKDKIPTKDGGLTVDLVPTKKIIAALTPKSGVKVGFKLETSLTDARAASLAEHYMRDLELSLFVINDLKDVDEARHRALVFTKGSDGKPDAPVTFDTKEALARAIAAHVSLGLTKCATP